MNVARPTGGFRMGVAPQAQASINAASSEFPGFSLLWSNVIDRLKFTAHLEGVGLRTGAGHRVLAVAEDEVRKTPRTLVAYFVLGDAVTIKAVVFDRQEVPEVAEIWEIGGAPEA